jgi:beta-galactosidase
MTKRGFSKKHSKWISEGMGRLMIHGLDSLGLKHKIHMAIIMLKYKLSYIDFYNIFMEFGFGWGNESDDFEIIGYLAGKEAVRKKYGTSIASRLCLIADDYNLSSGDWDVTRLVVSLVDQNGNITPFANDYVSLETHGPGEVIGPNPTALCGGAVAMWIRTNGKPGEIKIKGKCSRFETDQIIIKVI